jgi:DNA polymerase (family 10)
VPFDPTALVALGQDLEAWHRHQNRMLLGIALPRAELLLQNLARLPLVQRLSLAGSIRRGAALVGDINLVLATADPPQVIRLCNQQPEVRQVLTSTPTTTVVLTSEGLRVSLVAVLPQHFAGALLHYTGSAAHLAALRRIAQRYGLRLTEHGLVQLEGSHPVPAAEEQDIYQQLKLPYIPPELREDRGEIELAEAGRPLPTLVTPAEIQGDLHIHSDWGTGAHGLEDIARAAQRLGYGYVAICDYTHATDTARGLSPERLVEQIAAIRQLNTRLPATFRLLAGAEVEISGTGYCHGRHPHRPERTAPEDHQTALPRYGTPAGAYSGPSHGTHARPGGSAQYRF